MAEPVGELDTVEDPDSVVEAEEVFRLKVPVAVAHTARGDPASNNGLRPSIQRVTSRRISASVGVVENAPTKAEVSTKLSSQTLRKASSLASADISGERSASRWKEANAPPPDATTGRGRPPVGPAQPGTAGLGHASHDDHVVDRLPFHVRASATPRYTSGANLRLSVTSRSQSFRRSIRSRKSRKPNRTGFRIL